MPYTDMYEIIDAGGTIYSGTEEEMQDVWDDMVYNGNPENIEWSGDLKLVHILEITR